MKLKKVIVGLTLLLLLASGIAVADYDKAEKVYDSGDFKAALAELKPLAEHGNAKAQNLLGVMYKSGEGVLESDRTATKWYTKSAEQGYSAAQYNLGAGYAFGDGVVQNERAAYKWVKLAAAQGYAEAHSLLGMMYMLGIGVSDDAIRSYMWLSLAAYNGAEAYNDAYTVSEVKEVVKLLMTVSEIDKAQQMASRCLESGYTNCWETDKEIADKKATKKNVVEQKLAAIQEILGSFSDDSESVEQQAISGSEVVSSVLYIVDEIRQRWVMPANARNGMVVELVIQLEPTGEVIDIEVSYRDASATDAFVASVVKAVKKVGRFDKLSQLDSELFDANFRQFTIKFKPEDLRL